MRKIVYSLLVFFTAIISFNCQKEISSGGPNPVSPASKDPITASVQGTIFDETGQPAAGVAIQVGSKTAITNSRGYFRVMNASLDKYVSMLTAEKAGYFKAIRTFNATSGVNQVMIKMIKKISAGTIAASAGGDVSLSNGAKVALPANAVVNASTGAAYSGNVTVYASYIDPTVTDISRIIPGSLLATDKNSKQVVLTSYGMMAVELASASGEKLQIATGKTATLTTPIPASALASAPATISLWYIDEQTGLWKEEGQATKNGSVYTGEVKHFSYWNCDIPGDRINFSATLKSSTGVPLTSTYVTVRAAGPYGGAAYGYTDTLGQVSGPIPANTNLILEVYTWQNTCSIVVYSQNIGPYSSDINLGTITIPSSSPNVVTVSGRLINCSGVPVTNGYAAIHTENIIRYSPVNSTGNFSCTYLTCMGAPSTIEVYGVDAATQQQGSTISYPASPSGTNTGDITACGTSTVEFINYNIDGTDYIVNSNNNDTMSAYSYLTTGPLPYYSSMTGYGNSRRIMWNFYSNAAAGSYPLINFRSGDFNRVELVSPLNVSLTNYAMAAGNYFEGNFSGQFRDSSDLAPLHTINCSFRLRRLQ